MRYVLMSLAFTALAAPLIAQMPTKAPGTPDPKQVIAGAYKIDPGHTQVIWEVNHLGFSNYLGSFGGVTGTMTLDPANPSAAKVVVTIPGQGLITTVPELTTHLGSKDFFDFAQFPSATFTSTKVEVNGTTAKITGDLALHGVTKPVTLDAKFVGAGPGVMPPNATNVGFSATTKIKRSEFGIGYGVPLVSDEVDLRINAAFEKTS